MSYVECKVTGDKYKIGGTWREECALLRLEASPNKDLQAAFNQYGIIGFRPIDYVPNFVRKLAKYNENGKLMDLYEDADEAAKSLGKKNSKYLQKEIQGDGKAYGYVWKFINVED
mgnify:CR=1 FL=1|tara:strand:- start:1669 stop:2013 length:345 start_codon:yes stop_codon:yes gene_type:complete